MQGLPTHNCRATRTWVLLVPLRSTDTDWALHCSRRWTRTVTNKDALLGPIVCWCRPWNCLPSAAGPSRSTDPPSGTACRTTWYLPRLCRPSVGVWKHFCSRPRSRTLSLIPGKLFPTSSGSWSDFVTWTTLKYMTDWLIDAPTVVRDSEEIRRGRLKLRDLMPKYNGILGLILQQNSTNHCKNSNQFTA